MKSAHKTPVESHGSGGCYIILLIFVFWVSLNLNTDWTAQRMLGYLSHYRKLPMAEIVDEMLAILSDRNRIMQKHEWENTNAKWNEFLNQGFQKED